MPTYLKSKTVWFAILLAVLPIVPAYVGALNLTPIQQMVLCQAIAAVVVVLRVLTTQALADK